MAKYVFGVDVGGTTVKMGLFTVEGELLDKWEIKTRTEDGGKNVLPDIADSIKKVIESKKLAKEDVEGVGIGVPGPVKEDGTVLKCVNLGWGILNVDNLQMHLCATKKVPDLSGLRHQIVHRIHTPFLFPEVVGTHRNLCFLHNHRA